MSQQEEKEEKLSHAIALVEILEETGLAFEFIDAIVDEILSYVHPFNVEYTDEANEQTAFKMIKMVFEVAGAFAWVYEVIDLLREYDNQYNDNLRERLAQESKYGILDIITNIATFKNRADNIDSEEEWQRFRWNTLNATFAYKTFYSHFTGAEKYDLSLQPKLQETMKTWIGGSYRRKRRKEIRKILTKKYESLSKQDLEAKEKERKWWYERRDSGEVRYGVFYYNRDVYDN